jgi:hypothetical protein
VMITLALDTAASSGERESNLISISLRAVIIL